MENVRNRVRLEFLKSDQYSINIKQQAKITFNGIHKSYETYDSFTLKQNEVLINQPIHFGFSVLDLSRLLMYETYYDRFQPYFEEENPHLHYMHTDKVIISVITKNIIGDLKNHDDLFDFSNLKKDHEILTNKIKKRLGEFKLETLENVWIDELICLISKAYPFICGTDNENITKGISKYQSKDSKLEKHKKKFRWWKMSTRM